MLNGTLNDAAAIAQPHLVGTLCKELTGLAERAAAGEPEGMQELVAFWEDVATHPVETVLVTMTRCLIAGMLTSLAMNQPAEGS
jgi:hypothetical protein